MSCRACIDSCPNDALSITDSYEVAVDLRRCDRCGGCVAVCPVQAIDGDLPVRKAEGETLYADSAVAPIVKELLLYYHSGYRKVAVADAASPWIPVVERANLALDAMSLEPFAVEVDPDILPDVREKEPISLGRRAFLRFNLISPKTAKPLIVNAALAACFDGYQFFAALIDKDRCTLCSACLRVCPTLALRCENRQFVIDNARCVGCKLCQDICPEHALDVTESVAPKTVLSYPLVGRVCPECKQRFPALSEHSALCASCRVKKALNLTGLGVGMNTYNFHHDKNN